MDGYDRTQYGPPSVERIQGQVDLLNERINKIADGLMESVKLNMSARDATNADTKESLKRIHERLDALVTEVHSLKDVDAEIATLRSNVMHHDWLLKLAITTALGGLGTALWSMISQRLN